MTQDTGKNVDALLNRLETVLEAYGADRSRWPQADRELLRDVGVDASVAQADQARELDAILSGATEPRTAEGAGAAVAARILAQAESSEDANVVAFDAEARREPRRAFDPIASVWPAAALLAASLVIGVFLGQSDLWSDTLQRGFLSADASVDALSDAVFGLPLDALNFTEETL